MPTLRAKPVGDVELRHDLDAGDKRDADSLRKKRNVPQETVDAMPDGDSVLFGLEMDIACSGFDTGRYEAIDELDDRFSSNRAGDLSLPIARRMNSVVDLGDSLCDHHWGRECQPNGSRANECEGAL